KAVIEILDARPLVTLLHDLPAALGARLDITVAVVPLPVCHETLRQFDHVIASWHQLTITGSQHLRTTERLGRAHPGSPWGSCERGCATPRASGTAPSVAAPP